MKRLFDIIFALISMVIFALPIAIIYLIIRFTGGEAIYCQERIGYHGRPFTLYKFRTMNREAENELEPQLWCEGDERQTRFGRFLRAHHLDEFPQLWNILRGDMSFVGPRPERLFFINQIMEVRPDYVRIYALRPGIFSKATLYNGYTYTLEKMIHRLDMDLDYLEHQSIWLDLEIIWLTTCAIITGRKF